MTSLNKLTKNFLNAHWLRFENLPWDIQVALFFKKYKPKKMERSLEVGIGNGINTLLNLGGSLKKNEDHNQFSPPWEIKSWETEFKNEGWSDKKLHASWIHLHLPSCPEAAANFLDATQVDYSQDF